MDRSSFESFYQRHYQLVYRICYSYLKNTADTEDCTEDVFVKVLSGEYEFTNETHEKKWLTLTAINLCKDKLKHWWRKRADDSEEVLMNLPVEMDTEHAEIMQAVMNLPSKHKDVIILYYYLGYDTDNIAHMLKKPPSTIRNRLRDARLKLKQILGDDVNE